MLASDSGARGKRSAHRHIGTKPRIQTDTSKHDGCDEEQNALLCEGYIATKLRSDAERQMTAAVLRDSGLADSKNELAVTI